MSLGAVREGNEDRWGSRSRAQAGTPYPEPPTPPPGSCARTTGSCLRTSCCRLESSQSSGRTWVCPGRGAGGRGSGDLVQVWRRDSDGGPPLPGIAGRMYLFFGNKTSVQFQNFTPTVVHPGDLQTHILKPGPAPWLQVCLPKEEVGPLPGTPVQPSHPRARALVNSLRFSVLC